MRITMNLKKSRKRIGWSLEDLASRMKVTVSTIRNWEAGKFDPDYASILLLEKLFAEAEAEKEEEK